MESIQPVIILTVRVALGLLLALVLSVIGLGVAWGLFVFFGARTLTTLLIMFMAGAGIGAGSGAFFAWLRIDRNTRFYVLTSLLVGLLAGVAGALGGYQFGSGIETECCAQADVTPISYTALGATVVANGAMLLLGLGRQIITGR